MENVNFDDKHLQWGTLNVNCKQKLFPFHKKVKNRKGNTKRLEKELLVSEELNSSNENYPRYHSLKQDIEDINRIKLKELCSDQKPSRLNMDKKC